jgi:hypothetical protein
LTGCPVFAIFVTISSVAESPRPAAHSRVIVCYSDYTRCEARPVFRNLIK